MLSFVYKNFSLALFKIAIEKNNLIMIKNDLKNLKDIFEQNKKLTNLLKSSQIINEEKKQIINNIFFKTINEDIIILMFILIEKNFFSQFIKIINKTVELINEKLEIKEGVIWSKNPITLENIKIIEKFVLNKYKINCKLLNQIDKSIGFGIIIKIDNLKIEESLDSRINAIKKILIEGKKNA